MSLKYKKAKKIEIFGERGHTLLTLKNKYCSMIDVNKYEIYDDEEQKILHTKIEKGDNMLLVISYGEEPRV